MILLCAGCFLPTGEVSKVFKSQEHTLFQITGPKGGQIFNEKILLLDNQPGELVWLTESSVALQSSGGEAIAESMIGMCDTKLMRPERHNQLMGVTQPIAGELFRHGAGVTKISLPEGFGIPLNSNEPCNLRTQAQSLDEVPKNQKLHFLNRLEFLRNRGREVPMKALFCARAIGMIASDGKPGYFGEKSPDPAVHGQGTAANKLATTLTFPDPLGQNFGDYWYLDKGVQETRTLVTHLFRLKFDTKLHLATGHLYSYGRSLELRDLTADETLVKLEVTKRGPKGEVLELEQFSSIEGVPISMDHQYELVSIYDNTSDVQQKAAASMSLYLEDREFNSRQTDSSSS